MTGWWSPFDGAGREPERRHYENAFRRGKREGRSLELIVTVVTENLDVMLSDSHHEANFAGTAAITGVTGERAPLTLLVTDGVFRLFIEEPDEIDSRKMEYEARLNAADGRTWHMKGFKAIRHGGGTAGFVGTAGIPASTLWRDQTRLFFRLRTDGTGQESLGILTVSARDFLRQLLTIRSRGTASVAERCDTVTRFLVFFGGVLRDTYGGPFARSRYAPPNWWQRSRRELRGNGALRPETYPIRTRDGVELQLTRYRDTGGDGVTVPVMLAPGFGVRADSFAIDTVKPNIVELLCRNKYDVWLFDYRASPELSASREQFSIDDIALRDWPAAVGAVSEETRQPRVDVIAHCVGAMSFMMAVLAGALRGKIGSAICSQVGAHPVGSNLNEVKAIAGLGYWLEFLFGVKALRVTVHAADTSRRPLLDRVLKFYPTDDPCDNPVCRRIRFVFGESYLHANLNRLTHDAIIDMFGDPVRHRAAYASLRALRHLALILRAGRLVSEDGDDRYVTDRGLAQLDFRLGLMSGTKNNIFPAAGIEETFRWLQDARGNGKTSLRDLDILRFPDYAHMDCFIGARAYDQVFGDVLGWLDAGREPTGSMTTGPSIRL